MVYYCNQLPWGQRTTNTLLEAKLEVLEEVVDHAVVKSFRRQSCLHWWLMFRDEKPASQELTALVQLLCASRVSELTESSQRHISSNTRASKWNQKRWLRTHHELAYIPHALSCEREGFWSWFVVSGGTNSDMAWELQVVLYAFLWCQYQMEDHKVR